MDKVQERSDKNTEKENGILSWLAEDDAPEIGIAVKEPLPEYAKGVVFEFKKITWPTRDQVTQEFINVIIIVAIISVMVYLFDLGFDNIFTLFKGALAK
ncbi:MAG: preprotein translocase subunit SecE [Candidatus Caenarcaniphilales bacterium]|nr:preprotein translocase subunit SecE [Candidatus Caenarcaniphilales bacterium]